MTKQADLQLDKNTATISEIITANAVIARDISYMRQEIEKLVKKFDQMSNDFVNKEQYKGLERRVSKLESNNVWIVRAIGTAIITAIAGLFGVLR